MPRRLVIDADVARSAGAQRSRDLTSAACRAFLDCLYTTTDHQLAMSDELTREWAEHASRYAIRVQAMLEARRRLIALGPVRDRELRTLLTRHASDNGQRERLLKDAHLVETARRADRVICSRDDRVRSDLRQLATQVTQLHRVVWVNPARAEEEPVDWLRAGARHEDWRRLDNHRCGERRPPASPPHS